MKILNIHAGTTDQDIVDFIEKNVIPASQELAVEETKKKVKNYDKKKIYFEKKIWFFLDEINTCNSLGLISEIMCNNTYQGKTFLSNVIIIGACNPYRRAKLEKEIFGLDVNLAHKEKEKNLNNKKKEEIKKLSLNNKNKLVYNVNPLPYSLLNFVFYFGSLTKNNEIKYIENMIQEPIEEFFNKYKILEDINIIKDLTKKMLITSQYFIKKYNDISSVSLREIRRFNILLKFFNRYLMFKKNKSKLLKESLELEKEYNFYKSLSELEILVCSINLSIYICYYLRITNYNLRDKLCQYLNEILISSKIPNITNNFILISALEQNFLIKNIILEKGISKNRALLENLFALFVAINNKIPIFIVGKPGCSK